MYFLPFFTACVLFGIRIKFEQYNNHCTGAKKNYIYLPRTEAKKRGIRPGPQIDLHVNRAGPYSPQFALSKLFGRCLFFQRARRHWRYWSWPSRQFFPKKKRVNPAPPNGLPAFLRIVSPPTKPANLDTQTRAINTKFLKFRVEKQSQKKKTNTKRRATTKNIASDKSLGEEVPRKIQ